MEFFWVGGWGAKSFLGKTKTVNWRTCRYVICYIFSKQNNCQAFFPKKSAGNSGMWLNYYCLRGDFIPMHISWPGVLLTHLKSNQQKQLVPATISMLFGLLFTDWAVPSAPLPLIVGGNLGSLGTMVQVVLHAKHIQFELQNRTWWGRDNFFLFSLQEVETDLCVTHPAT